ncbi:MAG: hypothetical protein AAFX93_02300 [Verrucomicrobiota bacterium]
MPTNHQSDYPKVFVGTLYIGENELEQCIESIESQSYPSIEQEIIRFLPNKEAHEKLYKRFMSLQSEFDYFIKIDADMVLNRDTIVEELLEIFQQDSSLDHGIFAVKDWYSDRNILGMHMFSNRANWQFSQEDLFVDYQPEIQGQRKIFWDEPAPVADHSPEPSISHAYQFGFHRALKVIQRDRLIKNVGQAELQLDLLRDIWHLLLRDQSPRRAAVILGAERAFQSNAKKLEIKGDKDSDIEDEIERLDISQLISKHQGHWDGTVYLLRKIKYVSLQKYLLKKPSAAVKRIFRSK